MGVYSLAYFEDAMNFLAVSRSVFHANISKLTDKGLLDMEQIISTRMGNINKFCPWPALEQSFAEDLELIWREQKLRSFRKVQTPIGRQGELK